MDDFMNRLVDRVAEFLAKRPGLLPLIGVGLILINFLLQIYPGSGHWVTDSNLMLHLGTITSIVGILLIRALG